MCTYYAYVLVGDIIITITIAAAVDRGFYRRKRIKRLRGRWCSRGQNRCVLRNRDGLILPD